MRTGCEMMGKPPQTPDEILFLLKCFAISQGNFAMYDILKGNMTTEKWLRSGIATVTSSIAQIQKVLLMESKVDSMKDPIKQGMARDEIMKLKQVLTNDQRQLAFATQLLNELVAKQRHTGDNERR